MKNTIFYNEVAKTSKWWPALPGLPHWNYVLIKSDELPRECGPDMLAFRFFVRILRFSQAKILRFFSWLIAKDVKSQSGPHFRSVHQIL